MTAQPAREPAPAYRGEGEHALWHVSEDPPWGVSWRRTEHGLRSAMSGWCGQWIPDGRRDRRVHAIEAGWLGRMRAARVLAYRRPEATFRPDPEVGGYWISPEAVVPSEVVALGGLLERHAEALIELRIVPNLWPLWDAVVGSTLDFSGIRLRNAQRPPRGESLCCGDLGARDP
jgi:hypothetical protein